MPRRHSRISYRKHSRISRKSFPFLELPLDLQVCILGFIDLPTLYNALLGSRDIEQLFRAFPETILRGATSQLGSQIRNLFLTAHSIVRSIESGVPLDILGHKELENFLTKGLDTEEQEAILKPGDNCIQVLDTLHRFHWEISRLVGTYARNTYCHAWHKDNPGTIIPPLILSPIENHRISRAFCYLKLFGVLFYNYVDRFDVNLGEYRSVFLNRLSTFEFDEMVTIYQYMVGHQLNFESAYPHENCPYIGKLNGRNRDPFECRHCQGRHRPDTLQNNRRLPQEFWHIVSPNYLGGIGLWAKPKGLRDVPVKMWEDASEANRPNRGWQQWCTYRDDGSADWHGYAICFRNVGYCFWDESRINDLHLAEQWLPDYDDD